MLRVCPLTNYMRNADIKFKLLEWNSALHWAIDHVTMDPMAPQE